MHGVEREKAHEKSRTDSCFLFGMFRASFFALSPTIRQACVIRKETGGRTDRLVATEPYFCKKDGKGAKAMPDDAAIVAGYPIDQYQQSQDGANWSNGTLTSYCRILYELQRYLGGQPPDAESLHRWQRDLQPDEHQHSAVSGQPVFPLVRTIRSAHASRQDRDRAGP